MAKAGVVTSTTDKSANVNSIRVISLNCWGLKYISRHRNERISQIGIELANLQPQPEIVGLQEIWTQQDYLALRKQTQNILPFGKFYHSGIFGGGLAILSKWPIVESSMQKYSLNGRPTAFWRGDWYVGKGIATARIRYGSGEKDIVEVLCTHQHPPYEGDSLKDSYICHRLSQIWEIGRAMRHAIERGHLVIGLGDFNMVPSSSEYLLLETLSSTRDIWQILHPDSAVAAAVHPTEIERGVPIPTAAECLEKHGATSNSAYITWRWDKKKQKLLDKGHDIFVDGDLPDLQAQRLDYIFIGAPADQLSKFTVKEANVGMTQRHPRLKCSLSDHLSVETTISLNTSGSKLSNIRPRKAHVMPECYDMILTNIEIYMVRERRQRKLRLWHFIISVIISIGCFIAVWFSPRNYVSFILMLISTLGLATGVVNGLIGGLFFNSELRALKEFQWEIRNASSLVSRHESHRL